MSRETAIQIHGVGKRYRLGVTRYGGAGLLSERIGNALRRPFQRGGPPDPAGEIWALREISLSVEQGEVVGLIGRNGAGKSTLLKLLSRITLPTEGRIELRGRVSTLLEVGTGFHPELTGRDNVFLNGTILGLRRREIAARFDDIVEFSGVSRFIDTPVKRYSSGMYVRLAFSVAAHLEADILLVDEVLAVGDAEFQRKCLGKMRDVADSGRTIVFVSHNMAAVQRLCDRAFLIQAGRLIAAGPSDAVVGRYLEEAGTSQSGGEATIPAEAHRFGGEDARLVRMALLGSDGVPQDRLNFGESPTLELTFELYTPLHDGLFELGVSNAADGSRIATLTSTDRGRPPLELEPGLYTITAQLALPMMPGEFAVDVALHRIGGQTLDAIDSALRFSVARTGGKGSTESWAWVTVRGFIRPDADWELTPAEALPEAIETGQT
jgi:lipopolysaccharide transport system ATP-binding protein